MQKYLGVEGSEPLKKGFLRLKGPKFDPLDCSDINKKIVLPPVCNNLMVKTAISSSFETEPPLPLF